jgi:cell division protein FtsB
MNTNQGYIRTESSALVNTDVSAYQAAKMRKSKEKKFDQLLQKVDKLEQCVNNLKSRIEEIEKNGNR